MDKKIDLLQENINLINAINGVDIPNNTDDIFITNIEDNMDVDHLLKEGYTLASYKDPDLKEVYMFNGIKIYSSNGFNAHVLDMISKNSKLFEKYSEDLKDIFLIENKCYIATQNVSRISFFLSKLKDFIYDAEKRPLKHTLGFYVPKTSELFIILENSSNILSKVDEDFLLNIIVHELTHKYASEHYIHYRDNNIKDLYLWYKLFLSRIAAYMIFMYDKNKYIDVYNLVYSFMRNKNMTTIVNKLVDKLVDMENKKQYNSWMKTYRDSMNEIRILALDIISDNKDIHITQDDLNDSFSEKRNILFMVISNIIYLTFLSNNNGKLSNYYLNNKMGNATYYAFKNSYLEFARLSKYSQNSIKLFETGNSSMYYQEVLIPSEIISILNENFTDRYSSNIKLMFNELKKK